jgi:glucose/arabinose dehydrogenase
MRLVEGLESRQLFAAVPAGFTDQTYISGLSQPTSLVELPDGRLLVTQKGGQLRVIKNNALVGTPAVTLPTQNTGERGLLGVEIDPAFSSNGYVYLYYTLADGSANRVSRFTMSGDRASGETVLLNLDPLSQATNHNGGAMHFGPDGKLYVAVGENANPAYSQTLSNLHGKMLRLNADGSIPTDNPFYNQASGNNRAIWALGLRNPFTFSFGAGGKMYINDVGQNTWEEVNVGRAGANYGWPGTEGPTDNPAYDGPLHHYQVPGSQAIAGGVFYDATAFGPDYAGDYFFADYVAGFIRRLDGQTNQPSDFATSAGRIVDLDVRSDGSLLYTDYAGRIGLIKRASTAQGVTITGQPADTAAATGQRATFNVAVTGTAPFSYQWLRNGQAIPGATGSSYTTPTLTAADNGAVYSVRVSNSVNAVTSRSARLTVTANTAPQPSIKTPAAGNLFRAGDTIAFSGTAYDAQDGDLAASRLRWTITYLTGSVERPFDEFTGVGGGSFVVPRLTPYTAADVKYRITLTATDSQGAVSTVSRDLSPRTSRLNLSSNVGVPILLDGQPQPSPASVVSVEGLTRTIEAPATAVLGGVTYEFVRWSDGGARGRTINTPIDDLTLAAEYRAVSASGGRIGGTIVLDKNGNANWDNGETGQSNWTVYIDANNNARLDAGERTAVTDSAGNYTFTSLPAGRYAVRPSLPSGYTQTRPFSNSAYVVTIGNNENRTGIRLYVTGSGPVTPPVTPPPTGGGNASFTGYVVNDRNRDGKWSSGELGLSGRRVWIDADNDGVLDSGEQSVLTASNGKFAFTGLAAGTYTVRTVLPSGWQQTYPGGGAAFKVTLSAGQTKGGYDFKTVG